MSWCRFGEKCFDIKWPAFDYLTAKPVDMECGSKGCPGSSIYVYRTNNGFECCSCMFTETEIEMCLHIVEHDKKGDHVLRSLLKIAKERIEENENTKKVENSDGNKG